MTMGDLCEIVGTDRKVADFVKQMSVTGLQPQETGRSVISVFNVGGSNHSAGPGSNLQVSSASVCCWERNS